MSIEFIFRQSLYSAGKFFYAPLTYFRRIFLRKGSAKYKRYLRHKWGLWHYDLKNSDGEIILIYASSAGEFLNTKTFCQLLKNKFPNYKIALCTAGYDIDFDLDKYKTRLPWFDYIFIAPWDTSLAIRNILKNVRIKLFICFILLIENPFLLKKFKKAGFPTILVNGLMSKGIETIKNSRCPTFNSRRAFLMEYYKYYDLLGVQNEIDRRNFINFGVDLKKISVTGNMKFDASDIIFSEGQQERIRGQLGFEGSHIILVAGSIHLNEERLLAEAFLRVSKSLPQFRMLVVPRFMNELESIEKVIDSYSLRHIRKTRMISGGEKGKDFDVVLVDTFGELKQLYSVGNYVYMGGSSQKKHPDAFGSHNILEPLVYKKPIFFGPYLYLFKEITDCLEKAWPGLRIKSPQDLANGILLLQNNSGILKAIYDSSARIIEANKNSVYHNLGLVNSLLGQKSVNYEFANSFAGNNSP